MAAPQVLYPRPMPDSLQGLSDLALDLRWSTAQLSDQFWRRIAPEIWDRTRNPYLVLQDVSETRLREISADAELVAEVREALDARQKVLDSPGWFSTIDHGPIRRIAYFSMEFGLSESLPIYAGGLGILAGDHLKTCSDLAVPLVGIGLLYHQGYFQQVLTEDGRQVEAYPYNDPVSLPVVPVLTESGDWLRIQLELPGRSIWVRVWQVSVGRITLYLLDSNDARNSAWDRAITANLYGGGHDLRLAQEMVLGIGGWQVLESLEVPVDVCHMNEGHAAFVVLARARTFQRVNKVGFDTALWATRPGNVFTTHTPVPAGFDRFDPWMVKRHLQPMAHDLDVPVERLISMGQEEQSNPNSPFNMAWFAARGSVWVNGVSRLHGDVSRRIFEPVYPRWPVPEVPIGHVTNGVHMPSWDSDAASKLWTRIRGATDVPDSVETVSIAPHVTEPALSHDNVSDQELFDFRNQARKDLVNYVRERLKLQVEIRGSAEVILSKVPYVLDPKALTIGFARRFASYKRPNLILRDIDRLSHIITNVDRPVQIIVAGKAHPSDHGGKALIKAMADAADRADIYDKFVFLVDYDMGMTQQLAAGVDIWLNNPRRPMEACGTSGMKVLVNGGLNVSELDGWWAEAYSPEVGWALGDGMEHGEDEWWDNHEADQLYWILENEVIPQFYDRDKDGLPRKWLSRIRASMTQLTPRFNSQRMVREYVEKYYVPAAAAYGKRAENGGKLVGGLIEWAGRIDSAWPQVKITKSDLRVTGSTCEAQVSVELGGLSTEEVRVEVYADPSGDKPMHCVELARVNDGAYSAKFAIARPTNDYTARIVVRKDGVFIPQEVSNIRWA